MIHGAIGATIATEREIRNELQNVLPFILFPPVALYPSLRRGNTPSRERERGKGKRL